MKTVLSLAITAAISSSVIAAENNNKTEEMIITATRTEQTLEQTLSSVTLFDRADIEKFQATTLAELLSKAPGTSSTRNGGRGAVTSISLRGNQSDHTLFLIDGMRVGSSTLGSTALENLDLELIERIEVVRGPKSSLYGSDALGGVVNIITRRANIDTPLIIKAAVGNNNTQELSATAGKRGSNYQANVTASYLSSDGIDNTSNSNPPNNDDDTYDKSAIGFNGSVDLHKDFTLGLNYQYTKGQTDFDVDCTNSTTFASILCSPYIDYENQAINLSANWAITTIWTSNLTAGYSSDDSETLAHGLDLSNTFNGGLFKTEKDSLNWLNNIQLNKAVQFSIGYDYLNEKVSGSTNYDVDNRDNHGYYAQLQFNQGIISANLGARHDDNEQFGTHNTANANIGVELSKQLKLIASYGEAFKAPTFNDLYFPGFSNPDLVPEETDAYELSLRGTTTHFDWSATAYRNEVSNLIQYNTATFGTDQITSVTIEGLEFTLGGEFYGFDINTALTLMDTENDLTGKELARRPEKVLNVDVDKHFGDWSVGATWYTSSSRFDDANNTKKLNGYATVALRSAYQLNQQWKLQLKADNIFEKDYALAQASGSNYYKQPGLEVLFSVVYTPQF